MFTDSVINEKKKKIYKTNKSMNIRKLFIKTFRGIKKSYGAGVEITMNQTEIVHYTLAHG